MIPGTKKKRALSLLLLTAALAAVTAYFVRNRDDLKPLTELSVLDAALILGFQFIYLVPQVARFRLVFSRREATEIQRDSWFRLFVTGRLLNTLLPQSGNVYRGARLKAESSMAVGVYVGSFITFTWLSLTLTVFLALAITALLEPGLEIGGVPTISVLVTVLVLIATGPLVAAKLAPLLPTRADGLVKKAAFVLDEATGVVHNRPFLSKFIGLSVIGYAAALAVVKLTFAGLQIEIGLGQAALFLALLQASSVVNLTPSNLGIQEIGFGALAGGLGIGIGGGLLAASVIRVTGVIALLAASAGSHLRRAISASESSS